MPVGPWGDIGGNMWRNRLMVRWVLAGLFVGCLGLQLLGQGPSIHDLVAKGIALDKGLREGKLQVRISEADNAAPKDASLYGALERGMVATVVVVVQKVRSYRQFYLGSRGNGPSAGVYERVREMCQGRLSGSGFVVKVLDQPYVVTNLHVVEQASDSSGSIVVVGLDGNVHKMRLFCGDALYDFAILAFDGESPKVDGLRFRSETRGLLRLGEPVYAIGNPLGEYPWTIANGIVSGLHRNLGSVTGRFPFVQTTVPIHTGNSGGPLLDEHGEVVGMMSQIAMYPDRTPMAQTSFALDARTCERLTNAIVTNGKVERAWFGMQLEAQWQVMGEDAGIELPCPPLLRDVFPSAGSLEQLDRLVGSSLVQINGQEVHSLDRALELLESLVPYRQSTFVFAHLDGHRDTVLVEAESMSSQHLVEIANLVLWSPTYINARLEINDPVLVDVSGERWGQPGKMIRCYVLAAGVLEADTPIWYEIMKPEELGAAMQLIAPHRMIDLLVVPESQRSDTAAIRIVQVSIGAQLEGRRPASTVFH